MRDLLSASLGDLLKQEVMVPHLLQQIVDEIARRLQADRATIYLFDKRSSELVSVAAHLPEIREIRVPLHQGIAGFVARHKQVVSIPDCKSDSRFWSEVDLQTGYQTQTMLAGPLQDPQGHLLGVIQLLNKHEGVFSASDEEYFRNLSLQLSELLQQTTLATLPDYLSTLDGGLRLLGDDLSALPLPDRINGIVGASPAMREVFQRILRAAPTEATILLRGESGTGKGLIARALHYNSLRRSGPFVQVDCTTLPEGLMENELFGHERGAYTGAHSRNKGQVEMASGGTLFLDEIAEIPLPLQSKLLTLVQEHSYTRVGSPERLQADIRIVASTLRDLETLIRVGRFREDLYYRIRVVEIVLPPLRERGRADLERLINYFVDHASKRHKRTIHHIRPDALELLLSYPWPGNVRELENCLESAVIFAKNEIRPQDLPLRTEKTSFPSPLDQTALYAEPFRSLPPPAPHLPTPMPLSMPSSPSSGFQSFHSSSSLPRVSPVPTSSYPTFSPVPTSSYPTFSPIPFPSPPTETAPFEEQPTLAQMEARYIQWLLEKHQGNRSTCARILGIGRNTLLRKMKDFKLT